MTYLALYREWRPRTFSEVVGQDHVVRTLLNAIKNERLAHAYLLCGPRGTGKTSIAKILARAVNCSRPEGAEPCGGCDSCREIEAGVSMDVTEIDAASNRGIDEVRDLREKVRFAPSSARVRVFIVDEVHMLTNEAFNALLKTLEEPPSHAMFILATTEPHRVPLTILSRCQRFDFHRIGDRELAGRLRTVAEGAGISIDREAMELIVRASEGAVRDGLSILDQAAAYGGNRIGMDEIHSILGTVREEMLERAARGLMGGRAGEVLGLVGEVSDQGKDLRVFLKELNGHLRGMLLELARSGGAADDLDRLARAIHHLTGIEQDMRWSNQPRVLLEVGMVRAARMLRPGEGGRDWGDAVADLAARIRDLEGLVARLSGRKARLADPVADAGLTGPPGTERSLGASGGGRSDADPPSPNHRPGGGKEAGRDSLKEKGGGYAAAGREEKEKPPRSAGAPNEVSAGGKADKGPTPVRAGPAGDSGAPGMGTAGAEPSGLLKKVESRWKDILEVAGKVCPHIASYLIQGKGWPLEVEGNTLTVAFPRSETYATVAVGILDSEVNRRDLSDLIRSVCQVELRLRLAVSERKPPQRAGGRRDKVVGPDDVDALFGKDEDIPADDFEGFDP